jgi:acetyltransferase
MRMVSEIRSYPLLLGVRGEERKDIEGILDVMLRLDPLLRREGRITDIEANPLRVFDQGEGVVALDVRILLKGPVPKPATGAGPGPGTGPGQGPGHKEASA